MKKMRIPCRRCPLRSKPAFSEMTDHEVDFMERFKVGELRVEAGTTLMIEGASSPQLYTALEGMALRYKTLAKGRRQVINFVLPGDFIGLQAGVMQEMQHSVVAATDMMLCVFNRRDLWRLFRETPERAFDITWLSAVEEQFLGDNLAAIGQMSALERVAYALVTLYQRGEALDLVEKNRMHLPVRQQDLADAIGLSLVHTNKTLKTLRNRQLAYWTDGMLKIGDFAGLCEIAQIDPDAPVEKRPLI